MELRFAEGARATKDIDIDVSGGRGERLQVFQNAVALGFDEFTFQLKSKPLSMDKVDAVRLELAVRYRSRAWQTIEVDLGPSGKGTVDLVEPAIRGLVAMGLRVPSPVRCLNLSEQVAQRHRPLIEKAKTTDGFEQSVSDLLAELHTSHLGFFHDSARRASSRAALSAAYLADQTPFGKRWIFQDVHSGGAASIAGIEPGDILLSVDGRDISPPEHPVFVMGKQTKVEILGKNDQHRTATVDVVRPKGKKLHFVEPTLLRRDISEMDWATLKLRCPTTILSKSDSHSSEIVPIVNSTNA